jgi:hypothetical protein
LKRVFSSFDRVAVHHARNLLEAEGIRAEVRNQFLSSAMGELPPAECQAEVWVRTQDAARAQEVLFRAPIPGPEWKCSQCGETLGSQFTQCWKCGAFRISAPA